MFPAHPLLCPLIAAQAWTELQRSLGIACEVPRKRRVLAIADLQGLSSFLLLHKYGCPQVPVSLGGRNGCLHRCLAMLSTIHTNSNKSLFLELKDGD